MKDQQKGNSGQEGQPDQLWQKPWGLGEGTVGEEGLPFPPTRVLTSLTNRPTETKKKLTVSPLMRKPKQPRKSQNLVGEQLKVCVCRGVEIEPPRA